MEFFASGGELMQVPKISVGDILELKKNHPCGNRLFKVMRIGSDIRIVCQGCGRDMTVGRVKLEKSIKKIYNSEEILSQEGLKNGEM